MNYYNEHDNKAADWLESLIERGLIPAGRVDRRSIEDVFPSELAGYTQCHFFAGIGGWSYALQLAGWPADKPVWTGSCPCQPFSSAGKGKGTADERHLWPAFHWLISQCLPEYIFGEQVGGSAGGAWFDIVSDDLAAEDYTCGVALLGACSIGAPHIRQRLFWVANTCGKDSGGDTGGVSGAEAQSTEERRDPWRVSDGVEPGGTADWHKCRDGKRRPSQPGVMPLAYGLSRSLALIRGYGNAIVPQVAAEFILAALAAGD